MQRKVTRYFTPWFEAHKEEHDIKALLFDIDGTLVHGKLGLPGAADLLKSLREAQYPFLLVTNDANHTLKEKVEILGHRGIEVSTDEMVSAGDPLVSFVKQHQLEGKKAFVLGDLGNYAQTANLCVVKDYTQAEDAELVIMGEGVHNWQLDLTAALNVLHKNPCVYLISPNPDAYWPGMNDSIGIGAGGKARFIKAILEEAGIKLHIEYLGKPYEPIFIHALNALNKRFNAQIKPHNCLMLGDNLHGDILGAKRFGIQSGLLLTGITHLSMLENIAPALMPDFIFEKIDKGLPFVAKVKMQPFLESE